MSSLCSLDQVNDLSDSANYPDNIVHEFVSVYGLYFEFAFALAAIFMVPLFAAQTVVVSTGNDSHRLFELMAVGALDLWEHGVVQVFKVFAFEPEL